MVLNASFIDTDEVATDRNTLVFNIDITCTRNPNPPPPREGQDPSPSDLYVNHELLSGHLTWAPAGHQQSVFEGLPQPGPTNLNIVLAKLRPGQTIVMELHAVKGVGKDHAKYSPVGEYSNLVYPKPSIISNRQRRHRIAFSLTSKSQNQFPPILPKNSRNASHQALSKLILLRKKFL